MVDDFASVSPSGIGAKGSGSDFALGEGDPLPDGESLTVEQAIANLHHSDPSLRYYASWWLGRFRVREEAAIIGLIDLLQAETEPDETGAFPLRRNAARALGKVGDDRAIPGLIECLQCSDYYVREAAAQSLATLGDPAAVTPLMQLLAGGVAEAVRVPGKPHLRQPYAAVLEALGTLGATVAIPQIQEFLEHPVARVQYSAARALYQLTGDSFYGDKLIGALQGSDLQLRRSALMDLGAIGYLNAAEAISETLAENSLKLIALKGILEHNLALTEPPNSLTPDTIRIMQYMDNLL